MSGWFNKNKSPPLRKNKNKIINFVIKLYNWHINSLKEQHTYIKDLQKNIKEFQVHSSPIFINNEECTNDNLCTICLGMLLGPCVKLACDCELTLHEGCYFRLLLGGFNKCPQCDLHLSLHKYKPKVRYPTVLKINDIVSSLNSIIEDEEDKKHINIDNVIQIIRKNAVTNTNELSKIFDS